MSKPLDPVLSRLYSIELQVGAVRQMIESGYQQPDENEPFRLPMCRMTEEDLSWLAGVLHEVVAHGFRCQMVLTGSVAPVVFVEPPGVARSAEHTKFLVYEEGVGKGKKRVFRLFCLNHDYTRELWFDGVPDLVKKIKSGKW